MKAQIIRARIGMVLIIIGMVLILLASFYLGYNYWIEYKAGIAADEAADLMPDLDREEVVPDYILNPDIEMPTVEINERKYIGIIEIPSLDLKLAVLNEWSYEGLNISPCRYCGSVYKNDVVIAGHNYRRHFTSIKKLPIGENVIFKDVVGNKFIYEIIDSEVIQPVDVEGMIKDDSGSWDMTLFTCTSGGSARYALRCRLISSI